MYSLLSSLNLPGALQALEKPLGLPSSLTAHAEEIRQQQGLHKLRRSMREVETLKENDIATYKEGVSLLEAEASEDDQARKKYGTERWTRPIGQQAVEKLYKQIVEIDGYLKSANSSDEMVKRKLKESESAIRVLEGTDRDLEEYVPSSRRSTIVPGLEKEVSRLRSILNEISRTEIRRQKKVEAIREKAKEDDISMFFFSSSFYTMF
jgi:programmed cell death 6-interacting protein